MSGEILYSQAALRALDTFTARVGVELRQIATRRAIADGTGLVTPDHVAESVPDLLSSLVARVIAEADEVSVSGGTAEGAG